MMSDLHATIQDLRQQLDDANAAIRELAAENEKLRAGKVIRVINSDDTIEHVC